VKLSPARRSLNFRRGTAKSLCRRSRIAEAEFRLLIRHFALGLCAAGAASSTGIQHRSAIKIFGRIEHRLQKFNGVLAETFHPHPKECERRFDHWRDDLYLELLRPRRRYPRRLS
jgi:transposase-like protein